MPDLPNSFGADWTAGRGIQAVPFAPRSGDASSNSAAQSEIGGARPNPEWGQLGNYILKDFTVQPNKILKDFAAQPNPNPPQVSLPQLGSYPDWGRLFHHAPLSGGENQSGASSGGLDHDSIAAVINQLLGHNKLFSGSGGAWGGSGGGAWGG